MNPFAVLWQYRDAFLGGLSVTLQLVVVSATVGTVLGLALEWLCAALGAPARRFANAFAFTVAGIPALVILFWLYYPAQTLLGVIVSPFLTAAIALVVINTFSIYRIIADAIASFPKQYGAAAVVCGLTPRQIFRYVQTPILLRLVLPRWIDQQIVILHTSLFASLISVEETFRVAQRVNSTVYQPVVIYTAMALLFLAITGMAMYVAGHLRQRVERDFSER